MKFFTFFIFLLTSIPYIWAGDRAGTGAYMYVFKDPKTGKKYGELVDVYEARLSLGMNVNLKLSKETKAIILRRIKYHIKFDKWTLTNNRKQIEHFYVMAKIDLALSRLRKIDPVRANQYREAALKFRSLAVFKDKIVLQPMGELGATVYPEGYRPIPVISRDHPLLLPGKRYMVDSDEYDLMDSDNKAATILHEITYDDFVLNHGHKNSQQSRRFNAYLFSGKIQSLSRAQLIEKYKNEFKVNYMYIDGIPTLLNESTPQFHPNGRLAKVTIPKGLKLIYYRSERNLSWLGSGDVEFFEDGNIRYADWAKGDFYGNDFNVCLKGCIKYDKAKRVTYLEPMEESFLKLAGQKRLKLLPKKIKLHSNGRIKSGLIAGGTLQFGNFNLTLNGEAGFGLDPKGNFTFVKIGHYTGAVLSSKKKTFLVNGPLYFHPTGELKSANILSESTWTENPIFPPQVSEKEKLGDLQKIYNRFTKLKVAGREIPIENKISFYPNGSVSSFEAKNDETFDLRAQNIKNPILVKVKQSRKIILHPNGNLKKITYFSTKQSTIIFENNILKLSKILTFHPNGALKKTGIKTDSFKRKTGEKVALKGLEFYSNGGLKKVDVYTGKYAVKLQGCYVDFRKELYFYPYGSLRSATLAESEWLNLDGGSKHWFGEGDQIILLGTGLVWRYLNEDQKTPDYWNKLITKPLPQ